MADLYYSKDGETFNDESLQDLDLEIGDNYWFGECEDIQPSDMVSKFVAAEVIERMSENLFDVVGEHAEGRLDVSDEAEADLLEMIKEWADKNATISCYKVINVKSGIFTGKEQ